MAEALGIASGVAGLISLGLSVCRGILTYYNAFRDSQDDIGQMCSSVETVAKTLVAIDLTLQRGQFNQVIIVAVETSLKLCKEALDTPTKKLDRIRSTPADGSLKTRLGNAKRRMLYPFRESTLAKLREICHDLRDNLGLAINALNVSYITDILRKERCNNDDVGIAYIYFSYKDTETQTSVNILASLLEQLTSKRPSFLSALRSLYAEHMKENTRPSISDIGSLLQNIVLSFSRVFIIIDALDECADVDDVRFITLTELKKLQHRMLLLVMSRPMPDPEGLLEDAIRINVEASLTDIRKYFEQRIDNTRSVQKHVEGVPDLRQKIVTVILQKIKGMFLMARLYLDTLVTKTTVNVVDGYNATPFYRAAEVGTKEVIRLLYGADAGAKDHYGYTPFYRAADQGHEDIAKLLRAHMLAR
ncbi:hypothetical protein V8C34DRAFT_302963 [Trichoderma compactum]